MRQNRRQATGLAVSLFPFLAVLICTMGMLIVMLVIAVKSSSVKAQQAKQQQTEDVQQRRDQLLDQLDLEQFRVDEITKLRPGLKGRLEKEKLRRSHMDDEIRKLVQEAEQLSRQFQRLTEDHSIALSADRDESAAIERLKTQIADRTKRVQLLREEVAGRPQLYSIVPTRSAGGTNRRPIYVECTPTGIELQPSGIKIGLNDFTKPIAPGNPLDAALLATREYWNKFDAGSSEGEPYPLIVVRPGGATSYAIARRAMASWDDEFGYELVEQEKQLNWGVSDPNLKETLQQAIRISMQRQNQFVAAGRAIWIDGSSSARSDSQVGSTSGAGGPSSRGFNNTGPGSSNQSSLSQNGNGRNSNGQFAGRESGERSDTEFDTTKDDSLSRFASEDRRSQRGGTGGPGGDGNPLRRKFAGSTARSSTNRFGADTLGSNGLQESSDPAAFASESGSDQATGSVANAATGSGFSSGASGTAGTGGSDQAGNQSMQAGTNHSANQTSGNKPSMADQRGANWALPTRTPGATPYRRPVRVECNDTHYLVHTGDPERDPVRVEIESSAQVSIEVSIDELVNQVWTLIEDWGMAEIGGFWKPVLRLSAESRQGARRADELAKKLAGSGIEIERLWR